MFVETADTGRQRKALLEVHAVVDVNGFFNFHIFTRISELEYNYSWSAGCVLRRFHILGHMCVFDSLVFLV